MGESVKVIDLMEVLKASLEARRRVEAPGPTKLCPHGNPPPWWDCEGCRKESAYSFHGNFR